jgi:hypothetical protein
MATATMNGRELVQKTLTKANEIKEQREAAFRQQYNALVKKCASGLVEVAPESIIKSLDSWGVPVEKFQDAVELTIRRAELKAEADKLPAVEKKITDLYAKIAATNDQLKRDVEAAKAAAQAAEARHQETITPLNTALFYAKEEREKVEEAAKELTKCAPAEVQAEYDAARDAYREVQRAVNAAENRENPNSYALAGLGKRLIQLRHDLETYRNPRALFDIQKEQKLLTEYEEVQTQINELNKPFVPPIDTDLETAFEEARKRLETATAALSIV